MVDENERRGDADFLAKSVIHMCERFFLRLCWVRMSRACVVCNCAWLMRFLGRQNFVSIVVLIFKRIYV